jgi:hypothetical protein
MTESIMTTTEIYEIPEVAGKRTILTVEGVAYAFHWCPPGTFTMGSPPDEEGRYNDESQHEVTLTQGFWMLETQVTQWMWKSVMGHNPSRYKGSSLPVEQVSWDDCQGYIAKLNDMNVAPTGYKFLLPTYQQRHSGSMLAGLVLQRHILLGVL